MAARSVRCFALAAASVLLAATSGADVYILGQPGSYATPQAAVDAAVDGDVLLVEDGSYPAFTIDGKALTVLARNAGAVQINGQTTVRNTTAAQPVTLIGLEIRAGSQYPMPPSGLRLEDCDAAVRVQSCDLFGGLYADTYTAYVGHGLIATDCARVLVVGSSLRGKDAGYFPGYGPIPPGDGLHARKSAVFVYDSHLVGGNGSHETNPSGGAGGAGARVSGWHLFAAGTTFVGGNGGGGDYIGCTTSGDGGDGVKIISGAQARLLDNVYVPGQAGSFHTCGKGAPGQPIASDASSQVIQLPGSSSGLAGPTHTTDGASTPLSVEGQPGDAVWLLASARTAWLYLPVHSGLGIVPYPWRMTVVPAGSIGASGTLALQLTLPDLPGAQPGWMWNLQTLCVEPGGRSVLGPPLHMLVLNL